MGLLAEHNTVVNTIPKLLEASQAKKHQEAAHKAGGGAGTVRDGRLHFEYSDIHSSIVRSLETLRASGWATPDYLLAISGGGLIPARILRSVLRHGSKQGGCAAIKVIGLELYSDELEGQPHVTGVKRTQWLEPGSTPLAGRRILIVDEVDDSRATLCYAVKELQADIAAEEAALAAEGRPVPQTHLGVFVLHNKQRDKVGQLPESVPQFVAQEVDGNPWICYPWDQVFLEMELNGIAVGQQ